MARDRDVNLFWAGLDGVQFQHSIQLQGEVEVTKKTNEETSKRVAKLASKLLRSKKTSKNVKSVAASALTQTPNKRKKKKR